jgi:hypothetical protein
MRGGHCRKNDGKWQVRSETLPWRCAVKYTIVWSSEWDRGAKIVDSAVATESWIAELRDNGADVIKVTRDGVPIVTDDLPGLIRQETVAYHRC